MGLRKAAKQGLVVERFRIGIREMVEIVAMIEKSL